MAFLPEKFTCSKERLGMFKLPSLQTQNKQQQLMLKWVTALPTQNKTKKKLLEKKKLYMYYKFLYKPQHYSIDWVLREDLCVIWSILHMQDT